MMFREYFDTLLRRWQIVVAMPLLAALAAALISLAQPVTYEATAMIALAPATLSVPTSNQAPPYYLTADSPRQLPPAYTPTHYIALLKSAEVVNAVRPPFAISITSNGSDRSLIEITARGSDAPRVSDAANAYADLGTQYLTKILIPTGEQADTALRKLEATESALAKFSLDNGLGDFDLNKLRGNLALAPEKKSELVRLLRVRDTAESVYLDFSREQARAAILAITTYKPTAIFATPPTAPISPHPAQNALIGAGLGLLVGIAAAFAMEYWVRART
ncbi:MAG: hypothetical protein HY327_07815 [Chloroflexi bacterium]|nr:hypothetical protein [Chloroflexota bacterium]